MYWDFFLWLLFYSYFKINYIVLESKVIIQMYYLIILHLNIIDVLVNFKYIYIYIYNIICKYNRGFGLVLNF